MTEPSERKGSIDRLRLPSDQVAKKYRLHKRLSILFTALGVMGLADAGIYAVKFRRQAAAGQRWEYKTATEKSNLKESSGLCAGGLLLAFGMAVKLKINGQKMRILKIAQDKSLRPPSRTTG